MTVLKDQAVSKSSIVMGVTAVGVICGVLFTIGKLYGDKMDGIGDDVRAIHAQMQIDDARELADAEKFGRILARLDALESQ